ncbi:hypothetical protein F4776DRAFT_611055 [Hypoxylon sp. NC0597]|nr:hypothetical protein F4776DRAFT_611055 [Hypoxylon sp. NC0597]
MASKCQDFLSKITAALDRCRSKQPYSKKSALKAALKSQRQKNDLQILQADLEAAQQRLHLAFTASTRSQISHVLQELKRTSTDNKSLTRQLEAIQLAILRYGSSCHSNLIPPHTRSPRICAFA